MTHGGFVLAGGRSTRMGRDKALLRCGSKTLLEHVAEEVLRATGNVTLIGNPESYGRLGYPVYPDCVPDRGPLGGIYTALTRSPGESWNLIVACDFPFIRAQQLQRLLDATGVAGECVAPRLADGLTQPLCAAYHRRCLPKLERALRDGRLRMREVLAGLEIIELSGWDTDLFTNLNSPADWEKLA